MRFPSKFSNRLGQYLVVLLITGLLISGVRYLMTGQLEITKRDTLWFYLLVFIVSEIFFSIKARLERRDRKKAGIQKQ